jgi:ketosteroid isomerase-like protein
MNAKLIKALVCAAALGVCSLGQVVVQPVVQKVDAQSSTLLALERMWNQAQVTRDVAALQNLVGDRFVNTEWDGSVSNREEFLADIRNPHFQALAMNTQDMKVDLYGNTAVVTGIYHIKGMSQGKAYEHVGRFTDTWIQINGSWRCVASHTSLVKP